MSVVPFSYLHSNVLWVRATKSEARKAYNNGKRLRCLPVGQVKKNSHASNLPPSMVVDKMSHPDYWDFDHAIGAKVNYVPFSVRVWCLQKFVYAGCNYIRFYVEVGIKR